MSEYESKSRLTRELVAAYILDRADQYRNDSPVRVALENVAQNIAEGAVESAFDHAELDERLLYRVERMKRK